MHMLLRQGIRGKSMHMLLRQGIRGKSMHVLLRQGISMLQAIKALATTAGGGSLSEWTHLEDIHERRLQFTSLDTPCQTLKVVLCMGK
jgi:hypothetical protein